jgi:hypothetical protein
MGAIGSLSGTWAIKDDGRFCMSGKYQAGHVIGEFNRCPFWFKSGANYWTSGSADDRGARAFSYSVSR